MRLDLGPGRRVTDAAAVFWHPWFAWRPVYVAPHDWRWLEVVERKAGWVGASGTWYNIEYRRKS